LAHCYECLTYSDETKRKQDKEKGTKTRRG
jgi:hypothetical protein